MIQRLQTLWLALASIAALFSLKFSFYSGNIADAAQTGGMKWVELTGTRNFILLILTVAVAVAAGIIIFLYKDRKIQLRLSLLTLIVSLINIILYFNETKKFLQGNYTLTALISLIIPIFLVLAIRGIYKDEKLIRNADRLR